LNEKRLIEQATAVAFLSHYNQQMGTTFGITRHTDAPDVHCEDTGGNSLKLEITLTEDRYGDIQSALGRSDARSPEALRRHLDDVRSGRASVFDRVSCLSGNVVETVVKRIQSKLDKDYGPNVALVVRDASPLDWSWESVRDQIRKALNLTNNPFDKGIWIITYAKDKIIRIA